MMPRLIDANALIAKWEEDAKHIEVFDHRGMVYGAINDVKRQPTIDAVEVVRCRDCKFFAGEGMYCEQNVIPQFDHFYCYYGERRSDA